VIQGATPHAGLINGQVARALTQITLQTNVPVIDGVVAVDSLEQAIERSGSKSGNRGWTAALSAIEMASLLKKMETGK
jgi:6,7-dimethyl-8-ribityllumazine synthase